MLDRFHHNMQYLANIAEYVPDGPPSGGLFRFGSGA
jgi:hypothetical protein